MLVLLVGTKGVLELFFRGLISKCLKNTEVIEIDSNQISSENSSFPSLCSEEKSTLNSLMSLLMSHPTEIFSRSKN